MNDFYSILAQYGIQAKNPSFYQTAFIHRSFLNETRENISSNERLEFLGDSVLSLIVSTYLFKARPIDEEGELTNLRAYIVKTESLAKVANKLKLGKILKLSKGEELSGGRDNPQIMANTYEAFLGAIYLDQGIDSAVGFVHHTLLPYFTLEVEKGAPRDPKSELQEIVQSKLQTSPKYKIISTAGPDHAKTFTVGVFLLGTQVGTGKGLSKQQAEEEAAGEALSKADKNFGLTQSNS